VLLTGSRGGFLSLVAALGAMALLVVGVGRPRLGVMLPAVAGACLLAWGVMWVSGAGTLERLDQTEATGSGRTLIYQDTLDMIAARPEAGHGYGSFEDGYRLFQERIQVPQRVDKAHNTYLEHAAELGVPATVALYLGPLLLFAYCVRGVFARRKDQVFPLVAAGATVLVAVHSLLDFSLQIPAVAATYAAILGMGVAQSVPSARKQEPGASLRG
jgi:O-antigen ligase